MQSTITEGRSSATNQGAVREVLDAVRAEGDLTERAGSQAGL